MPRRLKRRRADGAELRLEDFVQAAVRQLPQAGAAKRCARKAGGIVTATATVCVGGEWAGGNHVCSSLVRHFILLEITSVVVFGSTVVSAWLPDWSLLRGAAYPKPYSDLIRFWRYAFFMCKSTRRSCKTGWMHGWMDVCVLLAADVVQPFLVCDPAAGECC
eukprot:64243-Chlamydomonas_euryale.AAC.1